MSKLLVKYYKKDEIKFGALGKPYYRPATPVERKLALTDEELEAEVRRRYGDHKSSLYGKSMWAEALKFEENRLRDLEAEHEDQI